MVLSKKKQLLQQKYEVVGFLDNSVEVGNDYYVEGVLVRNPNDILKFPKMRVIIMSMSFCDMYNQLVALGISQEDILFGMNEEPAYDREEEWIHDSKGHFRIEDNKIYLDFNTVKYQILNNEDYKEVTSKYLRSQRGNLVEQIQLMPVKPISHNFGVEFGKAVDRVYIERFIKEHKRYIKNDVMEIGDNYYTKLFGSEVNNSFVLHVEGKGRNAIKGNLATGEGIEEESIDCLICTQTIQTIYAFEDAVANIYKLLKPSGVALITGHCIGQISMSDYARWGEYWRYTPKAMKQVFGKYFGMQNTEVFNYGNVKTITSMLYGLCAEDLKAEDFEYHDEQYTMIVAAFVRKENKSPNPSYAGEDRASRSGEVLRRI